MKPSHLRGQAWLIVAGLTAAVALAWVSGHRPEARSGAAEPAGAAVANPITGTTPAGADPIAGSNAAAEAPSGAAAAGKAGPASPGMAATGSATAEAGAASQAPAAAGGRMIAIDPETGGLGAPSPEQMQALRAATAARAGTRTDEGLVETRLPDGTVILELDERFHDFALARTDRGGKLQLGCAHDHDGLAKAMRDTMPAPALEEE